MPTEIRHRAPQHYGNDSVSALPGSRAQALEHDERRSIGRRPFRSLSRFIVAVLIGIGFTLAWQSYGDEGIEMVRSNAPSLAWLLPVPKTKTPLNNQMSTAAIAIEVKQQLEPVALKVDIVQHSIVQLAAKIDELAANQVTHNVQAVGEDISRKTLPLPPSINAAQAPERGTKPDKPDLTAGVGAVPNTGDTAEADQPASNKCDIDACKKTYFTFNPADCTYQPLEGPRRLCPK
jgi:hypothetical protein